ncbi:MAG TPA: AI-2E family transporter [Dongiaceae bacterium]|nr:AI-2E family transporter [Dongiaceae bacterium]
MRIEAADSDHAHALSKIVILLGGIVVALLIVFCYFASSFCITIVLATFLSILVDPVICACERWMPRSVSSVLLIITGMAVLGLFSFAIFGRASAIADRAPIYAEQIRQMIAPFEHKLARMEETAGKIGADAPSRAVPEVKVKQAPSWPSYVVRGFGSVSSTLVVLGLVPFLMFFMLLQKEKWYNTVAYVLGPKHDPNEFATRVASIVRRFVISNVLVGLVMAILTMLLMSALNVRGAFVVGFASGILNLIPFLGAILASMLPAAAAVVQHFPLGTIVILIAGVISMHVVSANLIIPRFVGTRINIGPVAATAGILFWGWLWGIFGILLALPLTGIVKLLIDYHPVLTPFSNMLGTAVEPTEPPDAVQDPSTSTSSWIEVSK